MLTFNDRQIDEQTDERMAVTGKNWFKGLFNKYPKNKNWRHKIMGKTDSHFL